MNYDKIIIGAGLYGLYCALRCGEQGQHVLVLERDREAFSRATYVNQARIHMGYHYPRSLSTALKSAHYFERFCEDFEFCNYTEFRQIYATSSHFSWTNAAEFKRFCHAAEIPCEYADPEHWFQHGMVDGAFLTCEYTFDALILRQWFMEKLGKLSNVTILFNHRVSEIIRNHDVWRVRAKEVEAETPFLINATYASINEVHRMIGVEPFRIKYELCEIILCSVNDKLRDLGITLMDGPFFSIMPFGKTGLHSLTSVTFTPHDTSYDTVASFPCQKKDGKGCCPGNLNNCNECDSRPESAWPYMKQLAQKYLKEDLEFHYVKSLFSMKPILLSSEVDDSRPTVIRKYYENPTFLSVLSGKINTVYDLDEVLMPDERA